MSTETLDIVGVRVTEPVGWIKSEGGGWVNVGTLIQQDGEVEAIPRRGASATHLDRLTAAAVQVWLHGREVFECWLYHPGLGWVVDVIVRDPEEAAEQHEAAERYCATGGVR